MQASEAMEPVISFNRPGASTTSGFVDAATPNAGQDGLAADQGATGGKRCGCSPNLHRPGAMATAEL